MTAPRTCLAGLLAIAAAVAARVYAGEIAEPPSGTAVAGELDDATVKRITKGYTRAKRSDVDYYCRLEAPMGTRLGAKKCYTLDQLWGLERIRLEDRRKIEQMQKDRPLQGN